MTAIKELLKRVYERTEHYKFIQIQKEWEKQNILIDELYKNLSKLEKENKTLQKNFEKQTIIVNQLNKDLKELDIVRKESILKRQEVIEEKQAIINFLESENEKLRKKNIEKEKARRKLAGKIGGYQSKINRLETQVNFLKTNRRAPKLEEIKNYEFKRTKCKG